MKIESVNKSRLVSAMLAGALTIFSFTAFGQSSKTVKGEVLDLSCYMGHGAKGAGHKMCAQGCLDKGLPAGILGQDGKVYLLLEDHKKSDAYKKAIKYAAQDIEVTGKVINKGGLQSLVVEEVKVKG